MKKTLSNSLTKVIILLLIIATVLSLLCSCKSKQQIVVTTHTDSIYVERLIPVKLPPDSTTIKALLTCNSNGRVVLSQLRTETTRNAYLNFLLDSLGNLRMETIVKHDTIYVKSDSISVKGVRTQYEYIEKQLGKWDSFILRFGNWMFGGLCVVLLFLIVSFFLKIKK